MHFFLLHYLLIISYFFFFNDTATTEIYTLSLHDALPISNVELHANVVQHECGRQRRRCKVARPAHVGGLIARHRHRTINPDRKSTRLNSSHSSISYAVFCLKKKKKKKKTSENDDDRCYKQ